MERWIINNSFVVMLLLLLFVCALITPTTSASPTPRSKPSSSPSLYDALQGIPFFNDGAVSSSDHFEYASESLMYAEPENVTVPNNAWDTRGPHDPMNAHNYLYQIPKEEDIADKLKRMRTMPKQKETQEESDDELPPKRVGDPNGVVPPKGMRSAVPLGGLSTGSFEIRADGSFHEWTIINQSPAGQAKYGVVPDAFLAARYRNTETGIIRAIPFRTHSSVLPNVEKLSYSGSYPVTKLSAEGFEIFAYSTLKALDLNRSATPAVVFTLSVTNTMPQPCNCSFMLNLPLLVEVDFHRVPMKGQPSGSTALCADHRACVARCQRQQCAAWSWEDGNCTLFRDYTPLNTHHPGAFSGIGGHFDLSGGNPVDSKTGSTKIPSARLINAQGAASLWGVSERGSTATFSATTTHDPLYLFEEFGNYGFLLPKKAPPQNDSDTDTMMAACASVMLQPGEHRTVSLIFSYYFPNRTHKDAVVGNFYSNNYKDVDDVARSLGAGIDDTLLHQTVSDISSLHKIFSLSNFSSLHKDWFINSFSHARSAMWIRDGRWRQWEAYDCDDIDSVHNDYQRHMPYLFFLAGFPEINKMYAWAKYQRDDGMIWETLGPGCGGAPPPIDHAGGRAMGDVTSVFIIQTLEIYRNTGSWKFLRDMMWGVTRGAEWQVAQSEKFGLPSYMTCTYDICGMQVYPVAAFNGVMHLAAMKAGAELGRIFNDSNLENLCLSALSVGQDAMQKLLWYEEGGYYLAFTNASAGTHPIMGDTLYGQVLAYYLDLGPLLPVQQMISHLHAELRIGASPYGIRVITGRSTKAFSNDNMVWLGGSQDWTSLQIWMHNSTDAWILNQSYIGLAHVSENLHDMWNPFGIYAGDGFGYDGKPWVTSHYGFHMPFWYIPFAVTRQQYDASANIGAGMLRVAPVMDTQYPPRVDGAFTLPLLATSFIGTITVETCIRRRMKTLNVTIAFGVLNVSAVEYHGKPLGAATIAAGHSMVWKLPI